MSRHSVSTSLGEVRWPIPKYGPNRDPEARRRILDATARLVAEEGPGGASMADIARAAEVGKQTIYRWWPTRSALVADALEEVFEARSAFPVTDDPIADLTAQMRSAARLMKSPAGAMLRELVTEAQSDAATAELFRDRFFDRRRRHARDALARGVDAGVVVDGVDLDDAIDALYGPLWLRLLVGHRSLGPRAVDRLAAAVLAGLTPRTGRPD